jgi:hypothetical protein
VAAMDIPSEQALLDVAMDAAIEQTLQRMRREGPLVCGECLSAALARTLATDVFPVLQAEYRRPRSEQNLTLDYLHQLIDDVARAALHDAAARCKHTL